MERPATFRLVTWLMVDHETPAGRVPTGLDGGRWVVIGDSDFTGEIAADLDAAGLTVMSIDAKTDVDLTDVEGVVIGTDSDTLNLALAERARNDNPDIFVAVRQASRAYRSIVDGLDIDSVFTPTDLVAEEVLARVVTPVFWAFVQHAMQAEDDTWAQTLADRLHATCGDDVPDRRYVALDRHSAPAVARWLQHSPLTLGALLAHPDDRTTRLPVIPLMVLRDDGAIHAPGDDLDLRLGDQLLFAGTGDGLAILTQVLDYDSIVEYLATGRRIPDSWIWRRLTGTRARNESHTLRREDDRSGGPGATAMPTIHG